MSQQDVEDEIRFFYSGSARITPFSQVSTIAFSWWYGYLKMITLITSKRYKVAADFCTIW